MLCHARLVTRILRVRQPPTDVSWREPGVPGTAQAQKPQRGGMFIVSGGREPKLRQERHVIATCRPAGAFGPVRSRTISMALLTELCRESFSVLRSSLIQRSAPRPALAPPHA